MQQPGLGRGSCAPVMDTVSPIELQTKVREDFTITEKAPNGYLNVKALVALSTGNHDYETFANLRLKL